MTRILIIIFLTLFFDKELLYIIFDGLKINFELKNLNFLKIANNKEMWSKDENKKSGFNFLIIWKILMIE